jgi:trk system potassium uptake protein TrkH
MVMGKKISVKQKILVSYMLNKEDMGNLKKTLISIIGLAAVIEGAGILILVAGSGGLGMSFTERLFFGFFHSISAFCNAGFALFSDSLQSFSGTPLILVTLAFLIIFGGLSFGVLTNLKEILFYQIKRIARLIAGRRRSTNGCPPLLLNSQIVLVAAGVLILTGTLFIYALEHDGILRTYSLGQQYLAAFFQSVTLRTAGFNSIPFGTLSLAVLIVMILYMFIGGASGSTAGGIKVNTFAVILASVRAAWKNQNNVIIRAKTIGGDLVNQAYLIFLFGISSVALGTFILAITEQAPLETILFEVVSAFGTVGLSVGLTPNLSLVGKSVIILLMFIGRLGTLTVLAATRAESDRLQITFPRGNVAIG